MSRHSFNPFPHRSMQLFIYCLHHSTDQTFKVLIITLSVALDRLQAFIIPCCCFLHYDILKYYLVERCLCFFKCVAVKFTYFTQPTLRFFSLLIVSKIYNVWIFFLTDPLRQHSSLFQKWTWMNDHTLYFKSLIINMPYSSELSLLRFMVLIDGTFGGHCHLLVT